MAKVSQKSFAESLKETEAQLKNKEAAEEEIISEAKQEEKIEEDKVKFSTIDRIVKQGKISKEQIEEWKTYYNNKVFSSFYDEEEYYIYRYITRPEYKVLVASLPQKATEDVFNEMLVSKCLLYPEWTPDLKLIIAGGTIDTLSLQIRVASNFIPESVAIEMIQKL